MQRGTEESGSIPSTARSHVSEFERSLTDDLIFVISKSETGDPYAGLDDLKDIFGEPPVHSLKYPKLEIKRMGPQLEGEYDYPGILSIDLLRRYKLCVITDEPLAFGSICGKPIGQGTTFCIVPNFKVPNIYQSETSRKVTCL